jgi:hypothetical protein
MHLANVHEERMVQALQVNAAGEPELAASLRGMYFWEKRYSFLEVILKI